MQSLYDSQLLEEKLASGRHMAYIQRRINVDATSWRRIDVNATLYICHVPAGLL